MSNTNSIKYVIKYWVGKMNQFKAEMR